MDLRSLRQFVAVAEELSFRRAAERLHMSQPPLSVAIKRLEGDVGVQLFQRDRRGVTITPAGGALLHEARRLLSQAAQSRDVVLRSAAGQLGTLRMSFFPSAAYQLVPELLAVFGQSYPQVKVYLNAEPGSRQTRVMLRNTVDVALVVSPLPDLQGLKLQPLGDENLVLAVPSTHPLSRQKVVDLRTLGHEAFVQYRAAETNAFEAVITTACLQSGFMPRVEQTAPQMLAVLSLVGAGLGIALVPAAMQAVDIRHVRYVQVKQGRRQLKYSVAIVYDAHNDNPVIPAFLSTSARRFKTPGRMS